MVEHSYLIQAKKRIHNFASSLSENPKKFDFILLGICFLYLLWRLFFVLTPNILPGWDLTPHYHVYDAMIELLQTGSIRGYDKMWNAGYPVFYFYGPIFYAIPASFYLLTFKLIPAYFVFNAALFALPFLFLWSIHLTSRKIFGIRFGRLALLFGLIYLNISKPFGHAGLGIAGLFYNGLVSQQFALILFILILLQLNDLGGKGFRHVGLLGLLVAMIIGTHMLTAIYLVFFLGVYGLCRFRELPKLIVAGGIGTLLSSFYWIPMLRHLWLTSGKKLLFSEWFLDPLFYLYPRLTLNYLFSLMDEIPWLILKFPWPALFLLVFGIWGIIGLSKTNLVFLPISFLVTLVVLPRGFLFSMLDTSIHYYRFVPPIFILNLFLATYGLGKWLDLLRSSHTNIPPLGKHILSYGVCTFCFLSSALVEFDLFDEYTINTPYAHKDKKLNYIYHSSLKQYPWNSFAENIIAHFKEKKSKERVAIEVTQSNQMKLGSPHFFNTMLPAEANTPVIPGLLAESSLTHGFAQSAILKGSDSLFWASSDLITQPDFIIQPIESMMERLSLYGVRYLLSTSEKYTKNLLALTRSTGTNNISVLSRDFQSGSFYVFKLNHTRSIVETSNYRPFLFIDRGGMSFVKFSELWYKDPKLFDRPVIYTQKRFDELHPHEREMIGGLILSYPTKTPHEEKEIGLWWLTGKPLIMLNAQPQNNPAKWEHVWWIKEFNASEGLGHLKNLLITVQPESITMQKLPYTELSGNISFNNDRPTIIRYGYSPGMHEKNNLNVFMTTPNLVTLFPVGNTTLHFD